MGYFLQGSLHLSPWSNLQQTYVAEVSATSTMRQDATARGKGATGLPSGTFMNVRVILRFRENIPSVKHFPLESCPLLIPPKNGTVRYSRGGFDGTSWTLWLVTIVMPGSLDPAASNGFIRLRQLGISLLLWVK